MSLYKRMFLVSLVVIFAIGSHAAFAATTNLLRPNGNGSYTAYTGAGGWWWQSDYTRVDEVVCNGTYDYVYTMSTGTKESFTIDTTWAATGTTVSRIDIVPCASKHTYNSWFPKYSKINVFYRINGVDYSGSAGDYWLPNTTTPMQLATSSYTGLNHAVTSTTDVQVGVTMTQCGTKGCAGVRLSNFGVKFHYE